MENSIKLEKEHGFLPNTYLSGNDFVIKCGDSNESIKKFRKSIDYLNYFSMSEGYEIKLLKG